MKQVHISSRGEWRAWLADNHDKVTEGIWLVFDKKGTSRPALGYDESVEEALCFGWIDSTVRAIDANQYCRKFTPRRNGSRWSPTNKKRAEKVIREGRMTEFGLAKIQAAKRSGAWETDHHPTVGTGIPRDLAEALARNPKAKAFFESLAPTYRRHFLGWITTAKRPETRTRRLAESVMLLGRGQKLGLK